MLKLSMLVVAVVMMGGQGGCGPCERDGDAAGESRPATDPAAPQVD